MLKRLILFKGGVETLEYFSFQMAKVFEENGYIIYWYDLLLQEESAKELRLFIDKNADDDFYAFTFNFEGLSQEPGLYEGDWNIWNYAKIKVINMVVDHPLYYHKRLINPPDNYYQLCIDMVHVNYMRRFFPGIRCELLYSAGTKLMDNIPIKDRSIDIIFTGNYTPKRILKKHLANMDSEYVDFYESVLEYLIENPDVTIDEAAESFLKRELGDISDEEIKLCMPNMMYVDLAVRFHFRELAIRALADSGLTVHAFGDGYEFLECEHPENIIKHGGVSSEVCLREISRAKISLNVMPWFKEGAHDRVFNTMLNGGVVLTDKSTFLSRTFKDKENVLFFDLCTLRDYERSNYDLSIVEPMAASIKSLLDNDDKMQRIADAGYSICEEMHTWRERAIEVIKIFDNFNRV